jgi:ligand-binding sensor domain-containing protein
LKKERITALHFEEGRFGKGINKIIADSAGNVWCGTAGEGLYCYRKKHWTNFNIDDGMSDAYVYDLALAGKEAVVCGTDDGVNLCSWNGDKKAVRISTDTSKPLDKIIRRVMPLDNSSFIAGTQDLVVGSFSFNDLLVRSYGIVSLHASQTNALARTERKVLIGTENDGIYSFFEHSDMGCSPPMTQWSIGKKINDMLVDRQQQLWIAGDNELIRSTADRLGLLWPFSDSMFRQCHMVLASTHAPKHTKPERTGAAFFLEPSSDHRPSHPRHRCPNGHHLLA